MGRTLAIVYICVVVGVALWKIPGSTGDVHYSAARDLGANTRLARSLLVEPRTNSLEQSFRLIHERERIVGKYLKTQTDRGRRVTVENVIDWPDLGAEEVVPVELGAEPDWMLLNQGTKVEVWIGSEATPQHAFILAIVPSGTKWMALLRRGDIRSTLREAPIVRIGALPRKSPESTRQPSTGREDTAPTK